MPEGGSRGAGPIGRIAALLLVLGVIAIWLPLSIAAVTVKAQDTFNRTLASGWGTAEIGGSYTLQGPTTDFKVDSGNGVIALNSPGSNRAAALAGVSARDVDTSFRVSTNKLAVDGADLHLHGRSAHQQPVRVLAEGVVPARPHRLRGREHAGRRRRDADRRWGKGQRTDPLGLCFRLDTRSSKRNQSDDACVSERGRTASPSLLHGTSPPPTRHLACRPPAVSTCGRTCRAGRRTRP